jgi:phosphoribosylpyrophosphate synthetase
MISINKIMCSHVTTYVTVTSAACLCSFCIPKIMGRKGKEMSPDLKKVAVDLFKNGEKNIRHCESIAAAKIYNIRHYQKT